MKLEKGKEQGQGGRRRKKQQNRFCLKNIITKSNETINLKIVEIWNNQDSL